MADQYPPLHTLKEPPSPTLSIRVKAPIKSFRYSKGLLVKLVGSAYPKYKALTVPVPFGPGLPHTTAAPVQEEKGKSHDELYFSEELVGFLQVVKHQTSWVVVPENQAVGALILDLKSFTKASNRTNTSRKL